MSATPNVIPLPGLSERMARLSADNRALRDALKRALEERDFWRARARAPYNEPPPDAA